jgi:hypothetical protein
VACTEIGCGPALYLDVRAIARQVPQARAVRICLETTCRRFDLLDQLVAMGLKDVRNQVRVAVRMEVLANDGRTLLRRMTRAPVRRSFPNGPECPPPCYSIAVELQPIGLELIGAY